MGWKKDTSQQRVRSIAESIGEIEITDLTREMNLANVKLRKPKRIHGVHLYLQPTNEKQLIEELLSCEDVAAARAILRRAHLHEREVGRIIRDFDAAQIHFQGIRLHALTYRPIGDQEQAVARAVLMAAAIDLAARKALTEAFPEEPAFVCAAGASYGATLATKSGERGDSELLFLGDAANQGAKILDAAYRLRVTEDLREMLDDEDLGITVCDLDDGTFKLVIEQDAIEDGAARYGIAWTLETSIKRVLADADAIPVDAVKISEATAEIDKSTLGLSNSKLNDAVSAFADVDGFTAIVEQATTNARRAELVKDFHIIRYELNYVRKDDCPGTLRIQYQGDRIQTLRHLPHDDAPARAMRALEVAAGWQSSIRETLPDVIDLGELRLAIGVAAGPTLVSKLGTRGNRDVLALGAGVQRAERIQRNIDGDELRHRRCRPRRAARGHRRAVRMARRRPGLHHRGPPRQPARPRPAGRAAQRRRAPARPGEQRPLPGRPGRGRCAPRERTGDRCRAAAALGALSATPRSTQPARSWPSATRACASPSARTTSRWPRGRSSSSCPTARWTRSRCGSSSGSATPARRPTPTTPPDAGP